MIWSRQSCQGIKRYPDDRVFRKKIQQFVENKKNIDHLVGSDHFITVEVNSFEGFSPCSPPVFVLEIVSDRFGDAEVVQLAPLDVGLPHLLANHTSTQVH